jgi:DNA end-binding protein Ku
MAPRAQWKGYLKIDEIACQVALYTAATTAERTTFHMVNAATGHRVKRLFVDEKTGKEVAREDQVKGFETDKDQYVILEPGEIESVIPEGDKTIAVETFIPCGDVDTVYFDKPYFLAPVDDVAEKAFVLLREGLRARKVAALARAVLFRRARTLLIRPMGDGLVANTLNFDYEVRSAAAAFKGVKEHKIKKEMLDIAGHIIDTLEGEFDPAAFEDRYETALAELVRAKIEGKPIRKPAKAKPAKVVDLMSALRESAKAVGSKAKAKPAAKGAARKKAA